MRFAVGRDDLWEGEMRGVVVQGCKILLLKLDGRVVAYEDRCAHLGVLLSEGRLDEAGVLTCRVHQWQYDARTGRGVNPKTVCLRPFAASVEDGEISVELEGT